ncbi:MAG TPA: heparin lyase I family protein [Solirubrobacterales bacterium]|nr:heparin lyase I family protein [Solirubrobacterales bacterium]
MTDPIGVGSIRFLGSGAAGVLLATAVACAAPASASAKHPACSGNLNPTLNIVQPRAEFVISGAICSPGRVRVQQRKKGSWRRIGGTRADRGGGFSACVRLLSTGRRKVRLRAVGRHGKRVRATVRISAQGGSGCGLHLLKEDLATDHDPIPLWGDIDAVSPTRHQWFAAGGPDGGPFRRMTAMNGDLYHGNSERAELGNSDYLFEDGKSDTFYLYRAGMRRVTSYWMRLPSDFPLYDMDHWQVVMQMKQSEPATNADGTPVVSLQAIEGNWILKQSSSSGLSETTRYIWTTPAGNALGNWTHIVVDATYSTDPTKGLFQITIGGVASPVFHMYNLKKEISPAGPGLSVGSSIPSHLRLGIYHDPVMPGTHVDIADVQVFG